MPTSKVGVRVMVGVALGAAVGVAVDIGGTAVALGASVGGWAVTEGVTVAEEEAVAVEAGGGDEHPTRNIIRIKGIMIVDFTCVWILQNSCCLYKTFMEKNDYDHQRREICKFLSHVQPSSFT
jgi:hypothetical protein